MDNNNIWNSFLEKIKNTLSPILYETWFESTKIHSINNDLVTIIVPMEVHKKHLKENYYDLITNTFNEITGTIYKFEFVLEEEIENDIIIDTNEVGVPSLDNFQTNLDPKYTFENFVAGESNKFARAIALAVAEKPGLMYNPLFIYGNSGLGKTHLMHAIGNYICSNNYKRVLYVTSEQFVNDFFSIYKKNNEQNSDKIEFFKNKYRNVDVLMIDDIQYLEVTPGIQQELFNTINELHKNNKQIIICSDRSPDDLKKLEDRLTTRFNWGITVNIFPPNYELRLAILDKKIEMHDMDVEIPQSVKEYIVNNCTSDIRKLEGAITRVFAYATIMNNSNIDLDLAIEALKDTFSISIITKNKIDQVQQIVADNYGITVDDLKGKKRSSNISIPRQIAMYICRVYIEETLPKIGSAFGGKDHTTVMHSVDKIKKEILSDKELENEIKNIISKIK